MADMLLSLLMATTLGLTQPADMRDDFTTYVNGSDGSPTWSMDSVMWEVRDGKLVVKGPTGAGWLAQQTSFRTLTVEATVTIRKATDGNWKTAAVCIYANSGDLWHLALAEAPDGQQKFHFVELVEMRRGAWLAQQNLTQTVSEGSRFDWQYGTPYRLRLSLTPEGIEGTVTDPQGRQQAHLGYAFSAEAVKEGRPGVRAGGFTAEVDDMSATGSDPVPPSEDPTIEPTYPPFAVPGSDLFTAEATGFFRTQERDGRWWIITPDGHPFFAIGTDHCRWDGHWCESLGYAPYGRKNAAKYPGPEEWAVQSTDRLKTWGFNLVGAGGSGECRYKGLGHTEFIAFGTIFTDIDDIVPKVNWTGFPNVFSPRWERYCDRMAQRLCADKKNDPWLLGYFLDNELEWYGKNYTEGGIFDEGMRKPADHSAKLALVEYLRGKYGTVVALNAAWGMNLASFDAILAATELTGSKGDTVAADKKGFTRLVADEYFRVTTAAIRKADPNHMVIGCRFAGSAPADIWDIAGKYCDIVTFNSYDMVDMERDVAPGVVDKFTRFHALANKPMMITEWSFPALDAGLPCKGGAGMRVDTQAQKAECFRIYQEMLLRLPFMVGSDYFMWVDEPAPGISKTFPEDSNYGLVNEDDVPYPELTQMATRVHANAYALHAGLEPSVGVAEGPVVYNHGAVAATFTLRVRVDGVVEDRTLTLAPGAQEPVALVQPAAPGGHLAVIEVDPDHQAADGDRDDNRLVTSSWTPGITLPRGVTTASALVVTNPGESAVPQAVATAAVSSLPADLRSAAEAGGAVVMDLNGRTVPSQVDGPELAVAVGDLAPWACRTLLVAAGRPTAGALAVPVAEEGGVQRLSTGPLVVERGTDSGNVADRLLLNGQVLGSYNPLVWQETQGQNQWVPASVGQVTGLSAGPVRTVVDVTCRGGNGPSITAVDEQGQQEAQAVSAQPFEVSHQVVAYSGCNWVLARMTSIRNLSTAPLTIKGYFFYLKGTIGGSPEGDRPSAPEVPGYYASAGAAWKDEGAGLAYGCVGLSDGLRTSFWLDEGGGQHPDAQGQLVLPVTLQPGETYRDAEPRWLLIYGEPLTATPGKALKLQAEALQAVQAEVRAL
jgi:hypothetical protein